MNKIYNTLTLIKYFICRKRPLFMFVYLTKRTKFLVYVRLFNKRTNTNELSAKLFAERLVRLQP
ncbi:hypothetical protein Hanom_Chr09g00800471 [Helianthus anomalus]